MKIICNSNISGKKNSQKKAITIFLKYIANENEEGVPNRKSVVLILIFICFDIIKLFFLSLLNYNCWPQVECDINGNWMQA